MSTLIRAAESGYVPDPIVRMGIRRLLRRRLRDQRRKWTEGAPGVVMAERLANEPIAVDTDRANDQHYELPPEFFRLMLGPRLKYSSCHWSSPELGLEQAEEEMLQLTCERAGIEDGMKVLDLGCGWGSLSLWIADRYRNCRVTSVSNSEPQTDFIRRRAVERWLSNIEVARADVNRFETRKSFDRIVSVEMFEHVRNHAELLSRMAGWLADDGKAFVHIFCHRKYPYLYEVDGDDDWMARYFFTGGIMPSLDLLPSLRDDLQVSRQWTVDGTHYTRTLLAWLDNLDRRRDEALAILADHYGPSEARLWFVRWRLFLLACAELFGYREGREWMVAHYLFEKTDAGR